MKKLSVVLTTINEEDNIGKCLESIRGLADEMIVVDEQSRDKTAEVARSFGAKVYEVPHEPIFHINKEKALEAAEGSWILQLDADERVTQKLADEIKEVMDMDYREIRKRRPENSREWQLFKRHQRVIEERDGKIGKETGEVVAFFIPRRNYFLGKPLIHAGVYPDGVIRLVKKGKAHFPAKSVHEQIVIDGEVAWLFNDLVHDDSPTFNKYITRLNRYTDLRASEFKEANLPKNVFVLFYYSSIKPLVVFLSLYIMHKGFMDGMRGFIWSLFSSLHYPIAYFKYLNGEPK